MSSRRKQAQSDRREGFFERAIQGMHLRADERLAKRLKAKGKHKEADAATERVQRRRDLIAAE